MTAVIILGIMALGFGLLLGFSAKHFKVEGNPVVEKINDLLPQTQCGRCSYPGCRPYAEAVANETADLNQCVPGGDSVIKSLAQLLDRKAKPLNAEFGEEKAPILAIIKENECIGCTLCIQACPVDAIVGAAKQMHTVIAAECTGCELCVPPCPVDCIIMETIPERISTWYWPYPVNEGLER